MVYIFDDMLVPFAFQLNPLRPTTSPLRLQTASRTRQRPTVTTKSRGLQSSTTPSLSSLSDFESSDEASPSSLTSNLFHFSPRLRPLPPTPSSSSFQSVPTPPTTPRPDSSMSQNRTEVPRRTRGGRPMTSEILSAIPLHPMGSNQGSHSTRRVSFPLRRY